MAGYCQRMLAEGAACFITHVGAVREPPLPDFISSLATLCSAVEPFLKTLTKDAPHAKPFKELNDAMPSSALCG